MSGKVSLERLRMVVKEFGLALDIEVRRSKKNDSRGRTVAGG